MTLTADAKREVRELHAFFQRWFRGESDEGESNESDGSESHETDTGESTSAGAGAVVGFDHPEASLSASFRMVPPDGSETTREPVLDSIRASRGGDADSEPPFRIEIRDLRALTTTDDYCQLTYEEWQRRDGEWSGRRSTALFRRDETAPNGVVWIDLHETWIEGRDEPPTE